MISPTWLAVINGIATVGLALEGTGITSVLPPQYGTLFAAAVAFANTIGHSLSSPAAGPLVKNGGQK